MALNQVDSIKWLSGEKIKNEKFKLNDQVKLLSGPNAGETGFVISLEELNDDPLYLVEKEKNGEDMHVHESCLIKI